MCAKFTRSRTHNEQLTVASCGMILGRDTMFGAEGVVSVAVSHQSICIFSLRSTHSLPSRNLSSTLFILRPSNLTIFFSTTIAYLLNMSSLILISPTLASLLMYSISNSNTRKCIYSVKRTAILLCSRSYLVKMVRVGFSIPQWPSR